MKSIGTTLKKTTNQQMNPYLYYPQYGFGSWLKENAGTIGSVVGAGLGTLIAPGIGTQIGATLGGSIGGSVQQNNATNIAQTEQQSQLNTQAALANYNALNMNAPKYSSTFKNGGELGMTGMMKAKMALANEFGNNAAKRMVSSNPKTGITPEGIGTHYMTSIDNYAVPLLQDLGQKSLTYIENPSFNPKEDIRFERPEDAEYFAKNYKNIAPMMKSSVINSLACGGKLKAMGGKLESSDKIDGIAIYKNGGTHEESPIGGIPIGRLGRVEEGEVRFGNYIFSNRF